MERSRELQQFIDAIATAGGWDGEKAHCRICNAPTGNPAFFRDELSIKEYHISGMCQKCQDEVFGGEE